MTSEVRMMRKMLFLPVLLFLLFLLLPSHTLAEASLSLTDLPQEKQRNFLQNASLVATQADYADLGIVCFDVRSDGMVALGFNLPSGGRYAAVLDADGVFQYGYVFRCTGSFLLDWEEDGLGIIWVRASTRAVFDEAGSCLSIAAFNIDHAANRYINALYAPVRRTAEAVYELETDWPLALIPARLVRTDTQGTAVVLHDTSAASMLGALLVYAMIVFIAVCIIVASKRHAGRIDKELNS